MQSYYLSAIRIIAIITVFCLFGESHTYARKSASIVICAETGKVHHEHNPDVIVHPASLTKMMTMYLAFKALRNGHLKPNQKLYVSKHASRQIPTKLGLKAGTTIMVKDALLGCVTKSANDAAVAIAEQLGNGSEANFAKMMTAQARKLGMKNTTFTNASGVPNNRSPNLSTARDMAILSQALYKHFPKESKLFSQREFVYKGTRYANHNKLLGVVPGVDGIKTGFTNAAGFNLAASMRRDNKHIIAVVLGGENRHARDRKMKQLLEAAYKTGHKGKHVAPYNSIEDLLVEMASAETSYSKLAPRKPGIQKGVYTSRNHKVRVVKAKYSNLDELLQEVEKTPPQKQQVKKSRKRANLQPMQKRTSAAKKNLTKKKKPRVNTSGKKKASSNKLSKQRKI